jgi:hypothetical protein
VEGDRRIAESSGPRKKEWKTLSIPFFENRLKQAVFTRLRYQLGLKDHLILPEFGLLRLRRELNRLFKSGLVAGTELEQYRSLLHPPVPQDPGLRRRVQQPAPGFVLKIDQLDTLSLRAGERLSLDVCFFGQGIHLIKSFSLLLEALGQIGLLESRGRFQLVRIENACDPGFPALWDSGDIDLTPQILDLSELYSLPPPSEVRLQFITPARLMQNGRPLFRPGFIDIFPFLLRRVTGMCAAWADLEDALDVDLLFERAAGLSCRTHRLCWQDWRPLDEKGEVGGLMGALVLAGEELLDLWPLLKIGELFGLGKGAAFGAGRYQLSGPT